MRGQIFKRQIDAVTRRIFCDVAQNIGELKGDARLLRKFFCPWIGVAEDANAHEPHDRGNEVAVSVEIGEKSDRCPGAFPARGERSIVVPATSSSSRLSGIVESLDRIANCDENRIGGRAVQHSRRARKQARRRVAGGAASWERLSSSARSSALRMNA